MELTWTQEFSYSSAIGSTSLANFRINSLFDPETSTGTPYPPGFSAMSNLYTKYRVMGAFVKVVVFNTGLVPLRISLSPSSTTASVGSNGVDTSALLPNSVTKDLSFGYNNKGVLENFFLISDVSYLSTVTETTFQRVCQWTNFTSDPPESFYA